MADISGLRATRKPVRQPSVPVPAPARTILGKIDQAMTTEQEGFFPEVGRDIASIPYALPGLGAKTVAGAWNVGTGMLDSFGRVLVGDVKGAKAKAGQTLAKPAILAKDIAVGAIKDYGKALSFGLTKESRDYYKKDFVFAAMDLADVAALVATRGASAPITAAKLSWKKSIIDAAIREGIERPARRVVESKKAIKTIDKLVEKAVKTGEFDAVGDAVQLNLEKNGVSPERAKTIATKAVEAVAEQHLSLPAWAKTADKVAHPIRTAADYLAPTNNKVTAQLFGTPEKTGVSMMFSKEDIARRPQDFLTVERWAEAQVRERGLANTPSNRAKVIQEWAANDSDYAAKSVDAKLDHIVNYVRVGEKEFAFNEGFTQRKVNEAMVKGVVEVWDTLGPEEQRLLESLPDKESIAQHVARLIAEGKVELSDAGNKSIIAARKLKSIVAAKRVPPDIVAAMRETVKSFNDKTKISDMISILEDAFPEVMKQYGERVAGVARRFNDSLPMEAREAMLDEIRRIEGGPQRVNLAKMEDIDPNLVDLADEIEQAGYYVAYAPKGKPVSHIKDVLGMESRIRLEDLYSQDTTIGRALSFAGLTPFSKPIGTERYALRETFNDVVRSKFGKKLVTINGLDGQLRTTLPASGLYSWLDRNKEKIRSLYPGSTKKVMRALAGSTIRDISELSEAELRHIGFSQVDAKIIADASTKAVRELPASLVGMTDKIVNYLRGHNNWFSRAWNSALLRAYNIKFNSVAAIAYTFQQMAESRAWQGLIAGSPMFGLGSARMSKALSTKLANKLLGEHSEQLARRFAPSSPSDIALVEKHMAEDLIADLNPSNISPNQLTEVVTEGKTGHTITSLANIGKSKQSQNVLLRAMGISTLTEMTKFMDSLARQKGFTLSEAFAEVTDVYGHKAYKHPFIAEELKQASRQLFTYKEGLLTSPLMKTLNTVFFPLRFNIKTAQMTAEWFAKQPPLTRALITNSIKEFTEWVKTDEGSQWVKTNGNWFYTIAKYATAYDMLGKSVDAVTEGKLFDGRTGKLGGMPFGFIYDVLRGQGLIPQATEINPRTGEPFVRKIPVEDRAKIVEAVTGVISGMLPASPYSQLTNGAFPEITANLNFRKLTQAAAKYAMAGISAAYRVEKGLAENFAESYKEEAQAIGQEYEQR